MAGEKCVDISDFLDSNELLGQDTVVLDENFPGGEFHEVSEKFPKLDFGIVHLQNSISKILVDF